MDVVPTIYDLVGITPPDTLNGLEQRSIEGESFAASLTEPDAAGKRTQFYAMLGQRARTRTDPWEHRSGGHGGGGGWHHP